MNGYRKMMLATDGKLDWCKCWSSEDGKVMLCDSANNIDGFIDGEWKSGMDLDLDAVARRVNRYYADYKGWDALHIATEAMHTVPCCDCPAFAFCEAMENPDGWDDTEDAKQYPDDEG